jgi:anhydro-N-acetylmuramic acid kinase
MNTLHKLIIKKEKKIIGILSGTSIDSVSIVLVNIKGNGLKSKIQVIDYQDYNINNNLKTYILNSSYKNTSSIEDLCRLNFIIGRLFADCINKFLKTRRIKNSEIDLIGSHGQTVFHIPKFEKYFSFKTKSTLQIGDPSVIANLTGITTVADFRTADVAVDGDGAPLIPFLDYIVFNKKDKSRILLNIGGIANLTYLKKNCALKDIIAFDTGPGNMLIDSLMRHYYKKDYDKDCKIARKGRFNKKLFEIIVKKDNYCKAKPPKSTGREYYGDDFVKYIIRSSGKIPHEDVIKTVTVYTSYTIAYNINNFIPVKDKNMELLVNGGGANNSCIMSLLKELLPGLNIKRIDENGINSDNKEAVLFAVLANESINCNYGNIRSATNAKRNVILGKICPV